MVLIVNVLRTITIDHRKIIPNICLNIWENQVNLHGPGSGRTTTHEILAGTFGIPEFMPPNGRQTFTVKTRSIFYEYKGKVKNMYLFLSIISLTAGFLIGHLCINKKMISNIIFWKQMSDKHLLLFELSNKWIEIHQKNKHISEYLLKMGCRQIGIYGLSHLGKRLVEELTDSGLEVVCGFDRRAHDINIPGVLIISPDNIHKDIDVDTIIVTSIMQFEKIRSGILERIEKKVKIISLESILYNI